MTSNYIDHLIILYLSNQASDLQKQELKQWINASEANKEVFEHIKGIWSRPTGVKIDQKMRLKRDEIWEAGILEKHTKRAMFQRLNMSYWTKLAATFLIIFVSAWMTYGWLSKKPDTVAMVEKGNPAGQKSMHMLPDGTQVWMNAESSLTYPEIFSDTLRLVKLTGEAFFEVASEKNRPFIVEASGTRTEALGTAFNIHAYPEDEVSKVALLEGKVRVQDLSEVRISVLSPGEELFIPKDGTAFSIHQLNHETAIGWKQGILLFEGVDFKTFCRIIKQWYGVKIEVKGSPGNDWNIRARYKNESLQYVLRDISFNKNFMFELNDKELIINFNEKPMI